MCGMPCVFPCAHRPPVRGCELACATYVRVRVCGCLSISAYRACVCARMFLYVCVFVCVGDNVKFTAIKEHVESFSDHVARLPHKDTIVRPPDCRQLNHRLSRIVLRTRAQESAKGRGCLLQHVHVQRTPHAQYYIFVMYVCMCVSSVCARVCVQA